MADENYEERNAIGPTDEGAHFFAHLEILGLKNAKRQDDYDSMKKKVGSFVEACKAEIEEKRAGSKNEFGFGIGFRIDSDSFCVWTQNDYRLYQFDDLLQTVSILLVIGFKQGMPLRGVIRYGNYKVERFGKTDDLRDVSLFDNEELLRMTQNEAHDLSVPMDWSGAVLTRKAWEKIAYEFARGKHEGWGRVMRSANIDSAEWLRGRYLLPYDIPFEVGDCIKYNAINWNYNPNDGLSEDVVRKAFEGPCSTYDSDIESKQEKTLQFFECSQRAALTCKFSCLEVP